MAKHIVDDPFTGEAAVTVEQAGMAEIGAVLDQAQEAARVLRRMPVSERRTSITPGSAGLRAIRQ